MLTISRQIKADKKVNKKEIKISSNGLPQTK